MKSTPSAEPNGPHVFVRPERDGVCPNQRMYRKAEPGVIFDATAAAEISGISTETAAWVKANIDMFTTGELDAKAEPTGLVFYLEGEDGEMVELNTEDREWRTMQMHPDEFVRLLAGQLIAQTEIAEVPNHKDRAEGAATGRYRKLFKNKLKAGENGDQNAQINNARAFQIRFLPVPEKRLGNNDIVACISFEIGIELEPRYNRHGKRDIYPLPFTLAVKINVNTKDDRLDVVLLEDSFKKNKNTKLPKPLHANGETKGGKYFIVPEDMGCGSPFKKFEGMGHGPNVSYGS